jgi:hypothetical protein
MLGHSRRYGSGGNDIPNGMWLLHDQRATCRYSDPAGFDLVG